MAGRARVIDGVWVGWWVGWVVTGDWTGEGLGRGVDVDDGDGGLLTEGGKTWELWEEPGTRHRRRNTGTRRR